MRFFRLSSQDVSWLWTNFSKKSIDDGFIGDNGLFFDGLVFRLMSYWPFTGVIVESLLFDCLCLLPAFTWSMNTFILSWPN